MHDSSSTLLFTALGQLCSCSSPCSSTSPHTGQPSYLVGYLQCLNDLPSCISPGERSISPLLRAGEAAAERAAERVAQHGTEALAAHAGDVAVVAGVIHAGRSSSRGLTGLLDKMVDNLLASRFLRRFVSPAVSLRTASVCFVLLLMSSSLQAFDAAAHSNLTFSAGVVLQLCRHRTSYG